MNKLPVVYTAHNQKRNHTLEVVQAEGWACRPLYMVRHKERGQFLPNRRGDTVFLSRSGAIRFANNKVG